MSSTLSCGPLRSQNTVFSKVRIGHVSSALELGREETRRDRSKSFGFFFERVVSRRSQNTKDKKDSYRDGDTFARLDCVAFRLSLRERASQRRIPLAFEIG